MAAWVVRKLCELLPLCKQFALPGPSVTASVQGLAGCRCTETHESTTHASRVYQDGVSCAKHRHFRYLEHRATESKQSQPLKYAGRQSLPSGELRQNHHIYAEHPNFSLPFSLPNKRETHKALAPSGTHAPPHQDLDQTAAAQHGALGAYKAGAPMRWSPDVAPAVS
jgi:hypothetical protein